MKWKILLKYALLALITLSITFLILSFSGVNFGYTIDKIVKGEIISINLWENRLKIILIAFFSGGSLAVAGSLLQKMTKNELADISIIGIGSINIIFIILYVLIFGKNVFGNGFSAAFLPVVTLIASLLATFIIWLFAKNDNAKNNKFIIVGIALQLLFEGLSVMLVNPTQKISKEQSELIAQIKKYTVGIIDANIQWWLLIICISVTLILLIIIMFLRHKIDLIESSEELAQGLGINVTKMKKIIFTIVAILAATEAIMAGSIALLGILAPAIARKLFKNKTMYILPASFLIGGALVLIATYISVTLETQIPVGILSTTIIIPYFIYTIIRSK